MTCPLFKQVNNQYYQEYRYKTYVHPPVARVEEVNDVGKVVISFNSTMFTNAALNETEIGRTA